MSKLVLFIHQDRLFAEGATEQFPCNFRDELNFSRLIGTQLLLGNIAPPYGQGFVALGRLAGFRTEDGDTVAVVDSIRTFPQATSFRQEIPAKTGMFEISDSAFSDVIGEVIGNEVDEATSAFWSGTRVDNPFSSELASINRKRCSFSKLETENGAAYIIQPTDQGGTWHISNFLFLDPEAGDLFTDFAWSAGPNFEIIIDAHAVSPDISDTINRTGLLALPERPTLWPDRDALAWHFDQFVRRIKAR